MIKNYLLIISIAVAGIANAQTTKKACFLGNSYTASNNLPGLVESLATADGNTLIHDANTPGGYWLEYHSTNATSLAKIAGDNWDYVVLQEQSQKPSFPWLQVLDETVPYAEILCDSIRAANECAVPVFFSTWGRKDGDAMWDSINTFEKMNQRLHYAYDYMADEFSGKISPVGIGFAHVKTDIAAPITHAQLYTGDGSHPSIYGSYLAACIFYEVIFEESSVGNTFFPGSISASDATYLQGVADHVLNVVDSIELAYLDPQASFEVSYDGLTATFTNTSVHAYNFHWDFGDGETSTETNPVHTYTTGGDYDITLTASYCTGSTEDDTTITQFVNSIIQLEPSDLDVVNESDGVRIIGNGYKGIIRIYSLSGQLITETELIDEDIFIPLRRGVYLLNTEIGNRKVVLN